MSHFVVSEVSMAGLFKPFRSTSAVSVLPTLSKQVDGSNNTTNSKLMWAMSINFLVAGVGLANGGVILQKQNRVKEGREVNGYNTYTLSWLKNLIALENQMLNSPPNCSVNWLFSFLLHQTLFSQQILLIPKTMCC